MHISSSIFLVSALPSLLGMEILSLTFSLPIVISILLSIVVIALLFVVWRLRYMVKVLVSSNRAIQEKSNHLNTTIGSLKAQLIQSDDELSKYKTSLQQAQNLADEADILKSNFLANMSHEIRTPMNGILGFAQLLQAEDMELAKRERYLDIICHNGYMLVNLIDDIMDISRIEAGNFAINKATVNVDDIMFETYTFFNEIKYKQEKEHISIRLLNLNDDEDSTICSDGQRLHQVLTNLMSNSLKFTEKGTIEFGYINNPENKTLDFFVRDTGIGIPPDKVDLIFDRFRQVQEGSTRKYGGTGIGLYITKHIITTMGGSISVESMQGEGTNFLFSVPYHEEERTDEHSHAYKSYEDNYNWDGIVILVAEDVHSNFELINTILADTKASVIWAQDGEEAVKKCNEQEQLDIILMDIQMPKLNGYDAVAKIREKNPTVPIIAQTAYSMPNDNLKCIEAGCNDYISKPINSNLLLKKIESYLQGAKVID